MRWGPLSTRLGHPRCTRTPSIASPSPSLPFPDAFPRPRPAFPAPYARFVSTLPTGHLAVVPLSLYLFTVPGLLRYIYNSCIYPLDRREEVPLSPSVSQFSAQCSSFPRVPAGPVLIRHLSNSGGAYKVPTRPRIRSFRARDRARDLERSDCPGTVRPLPTPTQQRADLSARTPRVSDLDGHPYQVAYRSEACATIYDTSHPLLTCTVSWEF